VWCVVWGSPTQQRRSPSPKKQQLTERGINRQSCGPTTVGDRASLQLSFCLTYSKVAGRRTGR
jgi:hypothetical protein